MFKFNSKTQKQDNALSATWALFKAMGMDKKVTFSGLKEQLTAHPEYPSLKSVSDLLLKFKIENASFKLGTEQLFDLPAPFLAHLRGNGGTFVVIDKNPDEYISYTDGFEYKTEKTADFIKQWTGVSLVAEPNQASGEVDYQTKFRQERWQNLQIPVLLSMAMIGVLCIILPNTQTIPWQSATALILKIIGCVFSGLLLSVHIQGRQSFASSLCQLNDKTDCNSILTSEAAMLWGIVSWAEIGFLYYTTGILFLCFGVISQQVPQTFAWLACLSFLALPYTIYSVYYQWQVAKQWCLFCLGVQIVILTEALLYYIQIGFIFPDIQILPLGFFSLLLPIGIWILAKPLLKQSLQLGHVKTELNQYKNNPQLFEGLLYRQEQMPALNDAIKVIRLGNIDAQHTFVIATNPYCGPCAKVHETLDALLETTTNIQAYLITTTCHDPRIQQFTKHLLAWQAQGNAIDQVLTDWYGQAQKDYEKWAKKYPVASTDGFEETLNALCEWTTLADIAGTPTIYLNGYQLPKQYSLQNLEFILMNFDNPVLSTMDFAKSQ